MRVDTILMMSLGLVLGILIGALPGFTTTMAMAVLLPISFFLQPLVGIPFLIGVYKGGIYGGSNPRRAGRHSRHRRLRRHHL